MHTAGRSVAQTRTSVAALPPASPSGFTRTRASVWTPGGHLRRQADAEALDYGVLEVPRRLLFRGWGSRERQSELNMQVRNGITFDFRELSFSPLPTKLWLIVLQM